MKVMKVVLTLQEDMLGTVPKNKKVYTQYVGSKNPEKAEEEVQSVQEVEEKGWTGFHADENGLFVFDYFMKGFLKHAGNVMKDEVTVKNLRSKIDDFIHVFPRKIYLGPKEPEGDLERPLRAMTPQGPRVTLARSDLVKAGTQFNFEIHFYPKHKELTEELIVQLLGYGKYIGIGQFRNGGYGRFTFSYTAEEQ